MSCCPGIKCRNTGSGYEKQATGATAEMDARMKDLLAARAADDARIWKRPDVTGAVVATTVPQTQTQAPASKGAGGVSGSR